MNYAPKNNDTGHLTGESRLLADFILKVMKDAVHGDENFPHTGGCLTFYSPEEWRDRGESYGTLSRLIVCYDGGEVSHFFDPLGFDYSGVDRMREALEEIGYYSEPCTSWYSAIYRG